MKRRLIAALVSGAILGAQPGSLAFAGEVAKTVPAAHGNVLPSANLQLPAGQFGALNLPQLPSLPSTTIPGTVNAGLEAPQQALLVPQNGAQAAAMTATAQTAQTSHVSHASVSARAPVARGGFAAILNGLGKLTRVFAKNQDAKGSEDKNAEGGNALRGFFDGEGSDGTKVFLTEHGAQPVSGELKDLAATLAAKPAYAAKLNKSGRVRVIVASEGGALTKGSVPMVGGALQKAGVSAPVDLETIVLREPKAPASVPGAEAAAAKPEGLVKKILLAVPRELSYLGRTLKASVSRPTMSEVIGGVASKGPAFGMSVAWYAKIMLPFAMGPFAAAILFSFVLETFHGVFINTWQNLQNAIGRQRGVGYQTFFNLAYMQLTSAIARIITWAAIPTTIAPWQWQYWRDMGIVTFIGTFIGTLGFQGLNDLYNKGIIGRGTRSMIQQGRDLFFLLAGVFFASGSMGIFWPLFIAQQTLDLTLFLYSHFAKARPIAYVADERVASSADFANMYPVTPGERPSPLQQARDALFGNPMARLVSWPFRKGWELLRGKRK